MGPRIIQLRLLVIFIQVLVIAALTNPQDAAALKSLKDEWENEPPDWMGSDPCGNRWEGISCIDSRVVSIKLPSMGLSGSLSGKITHLEKLQTLDLSNNQKLTGNLPDSIGNLKELTNLILVGCSFSGPIPESIGSLQKLTFLFLNSNNFIGQILASIGKLSNLVVLDIADNKLDGSIPVSNGSSPGLDMLLKTKHFHFGRNRLSGEIPAGLFSSSMALIHLLLESNHLEGSIPDTLGLVQTLEVVRLDDNSLSGLVPTSLNNLIRVDQLCLSNNKLTGLLPNLSAMSSLNYVDMSNNSFVPSGVPPWFSILGSLETLVMERTQIQGELPVSFFSLQRLQTVVLRNNQLNGTLDIGSSHSNKLQLIDLQNDSIDAVTTRGESPQIILLDNPICLERVKNQYPYCIAPQPSNNSHSAPPCNGLPSKCSSGQVSSPTCKCAYPYTGNLSFRVISFSYFENTSNRAHLQQSMMESFHAHQLPVDSIFVGTPTKNLDGYPALYLQIFPSGQDRFNRTGIITIGFELNTQIFEDLSMFFLSDYYEYFDGGSSHPEKSSSTGIIIGAAVGGFVLVILLLLAGVYAFHQKERAEIASKRSDPFSSWDPNKNSCSTPQLKRAEHFSFGTLRKCTNNFSDINNIGAGGYGKVYRGTLPSGQLVGIKRAQQGSMEGFLEFKTEIELLSRVHHKNLVSLVGFCFDQGEQMLVYEYMSNGTLKDSLLGKSGIKLDWMKRVRIALGAAKGLQYLHDLANPPIIHRDIKSNNILLDEHLNAKVADFGLSKLAGEPEKGHVTTEVKGTMGYLDPEYYLTQQLTEKSDVYSFGVLLLELIRQKIQLKKGFILFGK